MSPVRRTHYVVIALTLAAIMVMYWLAADPPNPWILVFMGGVNLTCIGITIARCRAEHFGD